MTRYIAAFTSEEEGVTVQYRGARTIGDFWGTFRVRKTAAETFSFYRVG